MHTIPHPSTSLRSQCLTFGIVALCASCFSSKGIFVKSAYGLGADPNTLLGLRMLIATPFFMVGGWISRNQGASPLTPRDWLELTGLGFLGYYLSSYVNFLGLQYLSAGLERIVLYTYPSLVVIGASVTNKRWPKRNVILAAGISYLGICIAFIGESTASAQSSFHSALTGMALVFCSALTYAGFILLSGSTVKRIGSTRFTSVVTGISCAMVLTHFFATRPASSLLTQSQPIYGWAVLLALIGTVVPSYLLGIGLRRSGPQKFAIIGTIGPLVTLGLAWVVLGETVGPFQTCGFILTLVGGLWVSLGKGR